MLVEPRIRLSKKTTRGRSAAGTSRGPDNAQIRRERKLDRRIEYVASDWSSVFAVEHAVAEAAESRRLAAAEEAGLFRRMNFLKHRAERLRQLIDDDYCPPDTVDAIERLLEESMRLRNYLVQVFSKLAVSVARQYANLEFQLDELLSEAHVTLLRCVEIFDADRGYRFSTYATNAIRHNLNRYVSRQHRLRQNTREYVATDGMTAESTENPQHREREYSARMSGVSRWLRELDPREQTILRSRYGLTEDTSKATLQALAQQLGLSRERIRQLEIRAIQKLRMMASQASLESEA
ncbi:MAG: sigma-70 family RNA polymerase sigma factor [Pirellulaceae bacterium]